MGTRRSSGRRAAALAAAIGLVAACGGGGTETLDAGDIEDEIAAELEDAGLEADVTCPDDIEAVDGEEFTCEVEPDDDTVDPFEVEGEVDGDDGDFTFELPDLDELLGSGGEEEDEDPEPTTTTTEPEGEEDEEEASDAEFEFSDAFDSNENGWAQGDVGEKGSFRFEDGAYFFAANTGDQTRTLPFLSFPDTLVPETGDIHSSVTAVDLFISGSPGIAGVSCMIADPEGDDFSAYEVTIGEGLLLVTKILPGGELVELGRTELNHDPTEDVTRLAVGCDHDPDTGVTEVAAIADAGGVRTQVETEDEDGIPAGISGLVIDSARRSAPSTSEPVNAFDVGFDNFEMGVFPV